MSDGHPVVRTDNLARQFGGFTALRSVSLQVDTGQSLVIFGRNGAGKTTFLRIVATLTRSYTGSAELFGHDLKNIGDDLRRRIGFVSHESLLYADLSVRANLMFFGRLYRITDPDATVERMIDRMDLRLKASATIRSLSRGLKQRAALARAFLHEPDLLLLDEPYTGLDERAADGLDHIITAMREAGRTIIMTTHDAARGWRHADRAVVLERGAVAYDMTTPDTSYNDFHEAYREILGR